MKFSKKAILAVALSVIMIFGLVACSKPEDKNNGKNSKVDKNVISDKSKKDELVLALGEKFDTGKFDPKQKYGSHQQHRLTHSSLLKYDKDLNLKGDLASEYKISKDGLQWSFKLNSDVKFSNGSVVTADDVLFTYKMLKEDGSAFDLNFIKKIEKTDNGITFTLDKPRITFVSQLTEIPIVPAKHYNDKYTKNPIGSGPYVVKEYKEGEQIIMESNPYYSKPLKFKKLTFLLLKEDAALAAAKAGGIDVVAVPPRYANQKIEGMTLKGFESIDSRGITLPTLPSGNKGKINGAEVAVGNDVTSDLAIRQALNVGIDRKALVDLAMNGYGKPAFSLCDGLPWFNEKTKIKDGDVEAAKKILEDGGWKDSDGDGIVEKNGKKASFKLYYSSKDQLRSDLSIGVADQAIKFGIKIEAVGSSWDEIYKEGKSNAVMWGGGRHHPYQLYTMNSSVVWDQGYNNMPQFKDEKVDEYLEKAMTSSNLDESYKYWKLAQWDEKTKTGFSGIASAPIVWLTRIDHTYFINDGVDVGEQQVHPHGHEWALFNEIDTWKLK